MSTLMSISDGLRPYFFVEGWKRRGLCGQKKMEKFLLPAKVVIFSFIVFVIWGLFPFCTLTWHVDNYVSRQWWGRNRRNESTIFWIYLNTEFFHFDCQLFVKFVTCPLFDDMLFCHFSSWLDNSNYFSLYYCWTLFPAKFGNIKKQAKVGSCFKGNRRKS